MAVSMPSLRSPGTLHAVIVTLLLCSGGVVLGLGVWLQLLRAGGPYFSFYKSSWPLVALALVLLLVGLGQGFMLLCLSRRKHSAERAVTRPPFVTAAIVLLLLVVVAVAGLTLLTRFGSDEARDEAEKVWRADIAAVYNHTDKGKRNSSRVCDAEKAFSCRGFFHDDCDCKDTNENTATANGQPFLTNSTNNLRCEVEGATKKQCASCAQARGRDRGCYDVMVRYVRLALVPISAVAAVLAAMLAFVLISTCCAFDRQEPEEIQRLDAEQDQQQMF